MIEQSQKRTIKDLQQIIVHFQSLYDSFHSKSTSTLRILKQTSKQLSSVHPKNQYFNLMAFSIQIYQRLWAISSSKILKLQSNHLFYMTLKERIKQFQQEYQSSISNMSQAQKDISTIKHMHSQLQKLYLQFGKPVNYYNKIDRLENKKQLKEKLQEYLIKKRSFMVDYPSKKKIIDHLHFLIKWFTSEIDQGLIKGINVLHKIQDGFLAGIRQFIYYIVDTCNRQISKLQKVQTESYWIVYYKQFKNQNLLILTKLHQNSSQYLELSYQKYFKYCKQVSKTLQEQIRYSEMLISQIKTMIQVLNSAKRQIEKQLNIADTLKQKILKYCSDSNIFQSYKLILAEIIHILNITISNMSQHYELAKTIEHMNAKKKQINISIKTILGRQIAKNTTHITGLYQQKLHDLQVLDQIQRQSNILMKKSILNSLKKYVQDIKNVEVILISGYKQLKRNKQQIKIIKTDLVKQVSKIDLLNDDVLQKQITKSLQKFPCFTDPDQENPQQVFNCAFSGKISLLGKLKLYQDLLLFQSHFNTKNILFGKTQLIIPLDQIIEVTKESSTFSNAININTAQGSMIFTSFDNRNKAFDDINQYILNQQEEEIVDKNQQNVVEEQSVVETFTPQQMEMIEKKRRIYPKTLFQPYDVDAGSVVLEGTNIRKVFKQIYSSHNEMVKKRQKHVCFKEFALLSTDNSQVSFKQFQPSVPSYYDEASTTKLSQLESSKRVVHYKHHLTDISIPLMPKFGMVTETEVFYWVSDKIIIIQSQNATEGPPYSTTFVLKFRTMIQQQDNKVTIKGSGTIHFYSHTPFISGKIKSTGQKQIVKNIGIVQKLIKQHMKDIKSKRKGKTGQQKVEEHVQQIQQQEVVAKVQNIDDKLQKINYQNRKNLIIVSTVFVVVLILTHILF